MHETVWFDRLKYEEEVGNYQRFVAGNAVACATAATVPTKNSSAALKDQIAQARSHIKRSLSPAGMPTSSSTSSAGIQALEKENKELKKMVAELTSRIAALEVRVTKVEGGQAVTQNKVSQPAQTKATPKPAVKVDDDDDGGDDFDDIFGDDSDDDEEETPAEKAKREKLEAQAKAKAAEKAKGPKKPVVGKSEVILDVKPWDDETDLAKMEESVRSITMEGLVWGTSKLVPVGYGIRKLRITGVVVDDLVSTDDLEDKIVAFEDLVQSMDIFAFNKI